MKGGRVNEQTRVWTGAMVGAVLGAAAAYLFFTDRGNELRNRIEPALDDARREFSRFQKTIEKFGDLANDGMRMVQEFQAARAAHTPFPTDRTSH
jgi:gas vesicle protein